MWIPRRSAGWASVTRHPFRASGAERFIQVFGFHCRNETNGYLFWSDFAESKTVSARTHLTPAAARAIRLHVDCQPLGEDPDAVEHKVQHVYRSFRSVIWHTQGSGTGIR